MNRLPQSVLRLALPLALITIPTLGLAQALIWRNDWTVVSPPTLESDFLQSFYQPEPEPFVFSSDGEILMHASARTGVDDQYTRFTSVGVVRWQVNLGSATTNAAMLANSDGSAFVATQAGNALAKIDADGTIGWSDFVLANYLAAASSQVVAVLGCNSLVALDSTTGQVIWTYNFANAPNQCTATALVADTSGDVYASFSIYPEDANAYEAHLLKFDPIGNVLWEDVESVGGEMHVVGVGATQVYFTTDSSAQPQLVQAIDGESGSIVWAANAAYGLGMAGSPAEILVASSTGLQRLNALDGSARWSQPEVGGSYLNFLFLGSSNSAVIGLSQVDANTGSVTWTAALPSYDANGYPLYYFAGGPLVDGSFAFAGSSSLYGAEPVVERVDSTSGTLLAPIPLQLAAQGVNAESVIADASTITSVVPVSTGAGIAIDLRAVNATDGSLRWETSNSSLPFGYGPNSNPAGVNLGIVGSNGAAAVLVSGTFATNYNVGAAWVGAFDLSTGAQRWTQLLSNIADQQGPTTTYDPISDAEGNVIVAYATTITVPAGYPPPAAQSQLSIVKLSAADGSVLWRHDDIFPNAYEQTWPQSIMMLGSNVVVAGGPFAAPYESSTVLELSGEDGSVVWSSNVLYWEESPGSSVLGIYPVDDGNVVVTGELGWAKLDAQTGAMIWSNIPTCSESCGSGAGALVLPGGDLLFTGESNYKLIFVLVPGSPGATPISWSPDQADQNLNYSSGSNLTLDSSGNIWVRVYRQYLYGADIDYLAQIDPRARTFTTQQAVAAGSGRDPLLQTLSTFQLAAPANNQMLGTTFAKNPPQPWTTGLVLADTTITANGDLAVQFVTDQASASIGQLVGFDLSVTYSGDAPIAGATLIADFPWFGRAANPVCTTQSASNCMIDSRAETVVATFDMQPGGRIDVTGKFRDSGGNDPAVLGAIVSGPIGLNELNTLNNSVRALVNQDLFSDGFELTP